MEAVLQAAEIGFSTRHRNDDLPIEKARPCSQDLPDLPELRKGRWRLLVIAALHPDPAALDEGDGPHAVPFDLEGPPVIGGGEDPEVASIGRNSFGKGLKPSGAGSMRWIIQFLPPVGNRT